MATNHTSTVIQQPLTATGPGDEADQADGQLLRRFIEHRDEAAFEVLVRRHGPMVMGVCLRVVRNRQDAEDAFQATFLVLVRKAASIASRELLANWLFGVAYNTALKAKAATAKRQLREKQVMAMPEPAVGKQDLRSDDLQAILDQELSRLPEKYRVPIVLCDLEGKTRKEAAGQLGCPEGSVSSRLARARVMLANRLIRKGIVLSSGSLVVQLVNAASACVPTSLVVSTVKAGTLLAAGQVATAAISVKVAALTEGVLKTMMLTKLKMVAVVTVLLSMVAVGGGLLTYYTAAAQQGHVEKQPAEDKKVDAAASKNDAIKEGEAGKTHKFKKADLPKLITVKAADTIVIIEEVKPADVEEITAKSSNANVKVKVQPAVGEMWLVINGSKKSKAKVEWQYATVTGRVGGHKGLEIEFE